MLSSALLGVVGNAVCPRAVFTLATRFPCPSVCPDRAFWASLYSLSVWEVQSLQAAVPAKAYPWSHWLIGKAKEHCSRYRQWGKVWGVVVDLKPALSDPETTPGFSTWRTGPSFSSWPQLKLLWGSRTSLCLLQWSLMAITHRVVVGRHQDHEA